jgi:putative phage-type endonuclease
VTVIDMHEAERARWLAERKTGLGGSDAPAVFGISPWVSPLRLWLDKRGEPGAEQEENPAMHWGKLLEPVVADEFARTTGLRAVTVAEWHGRPDHEIVIVRHPDHPHLLATLDRVILDEHGIPYSELQVKTGSAWAAEEWPPSGHWEEGGPAHVEVQVQHELAVTGFAEAHVAVLIGGSDFRTYRVDRDDELIADLVHGETVFWEMVQTGTEPAADGHPDTARTLADRWEPTPRSNVDLPFGFLDVLDEHRAAKAAAEAAKEELARTTNTIKSALGEHTDGWCDGRLTVTWRWSRSGDRRLIVK